MPHREFFFSKYPFYLQNWETSLQPTSLNRVGRTCLTPNQVTTVLSNSNYCPYRCTTQERRPFNDGLHSKISQLITNRRAQINPVKSTTADAVCCWIFWVFSHSRPTRTPFFPFLDPLNLFPCFIVKIPYGVKDLSMGGLVKVCDKFFSHRRHRWIKVSTPFYFLSIGLFINIKYANFGYYLLIFVFFWSISYFQ